jgi:hypothetical protein
MDTELIRSKAEEINRMHKDVFEAFKLGLDGAIRIGELLTECKKEVGHGGWMQWMKDNLTFSQHSANYYMRLYAERSNPKLVSLTNLWEAELALIEHKVKEPELPKEPELLPEEEPEPLPVRLQPYVEEAEEETEPEVEEPEIDEQDELVKEIKDDFARLDANHKDEVIDWLFAQGRPARKAA